MTDLLIALLLASIGVELFATPQPQLSRRTPFWYSALAQDGVLFIALSAQRLRVSETVQETEHGQNDDKRACVIESPIEKKPLALVVNKSSSVWSWHDRLEDKGRIPDQEETPCLGC